MRRKASTRTRSAHALRATVWAAIVAAVALTVLAITPSAARADSSFSITGGGWGHGVGMTQYGAHGYAHKGWPYDDILRWYFGGERSGTTTGTKVVTLGSLGYSANPTVNVSLDQNKATRASWTVRAWGSRLRATDSTGKVADLTKDGYHTFKVSSGKVVVGSTTLTSPVTLTSTDSNGSTPLLVVKDASGPSLSSSYPNGYTYLRYRGKILLTISGSSLRGVNAVPMEEYLLGVVPRESPAEWGKDTPDALKAQAVAARSYAWGCSVPSPVTGSSLSGILYPTTKNQVYAAHSRLVGGSNTNISAHESTYSNSAVSATAGQIVSHPSAPNKVVTTYFGAASGGHTANIEDAWLGSTPKPYYVGVADEDSSAGTYATWTPATKTGTQIADALRARDAGNNVRDYTVASPATVTDVVEEKASSGWVRYATVRWSNGSSYRITADTFRLALGLRSNKFTVTPSTPPTTNTYTRYQQTDYRIRYGGTWTAYKNSRLSGGSYTYAAATGRTATFTFNGSGFRWITAKGPTNGRADVYLDGTRIATVDLYAASTAWQQVVFSKTNLAPGTTHTVTIRVLGTKRAASRGRNAGVDAVEVLNGSMLKPPSTSVPLLFENTDPRVKYTGTWTTYSEPNLSGGSYVYARETTASATFTFSGTRARIVSMKYWGNGQAWVYLDSRPGVLVDAYSPTQLFRQPLWDSGELAAGTHSVRVVPTATKGADATGYAFGIDRIDIWGGVLR